MKMPLKKERIFRVIIEKDEFDFKFVQKKTGLSKSFVSKTLSELAEKNLLMKYNGKYKVLKKEALLKEWAAMKRRIFISLKPLKLFILMKDKIKNIFKSHAISGTFAEHLVSGQTEGEKLIIYIKKDKIKNKEILRYLSKKPNVFLYIYDEHVAYNSWKIKGWSIVSVPQLCVDLIAEGVYADVGWDLFRRWSNANR